MIFVFAAAAVGGVVWMLLKTNATDTLSRPDQTVETEQQSTISLDPATDEQSSAENSSVKNDVHQSNEGEQPSVESESVDVVLTRVSVDDSLITAAGYVDADVSGKCKLEIISGNQAKTYTEESQTDPANPENTNCSNFRIPKSEFDDLSNWTVQLSFSSDKHTGQSLKWECQSDNCEPS